MDEIEQLKSREDNRLSPEVLRPTVVRTVDDIKIILSEIDPSRTTASKDIDIMTLMDVPNGKPNERYRVTAKTRSKTRREYLIEGMEIVRKTIEISNEEQIATIVNGIEVRPARMLDRTTMRAWVDNLISHWLGAAREGLLITWKLEDGYQYNYEIYGHKLTRTKIA
jgi:arginine repressor